MMDERTILLVLPILVLQIALMIFALVDLVRNPNPNGPKWMWAAIIVLLNLIQQHLFPSWRWQPRLAGTCTV